MALNQEDLHRARNAVQMYWGSHLYVKVEPHASPSMNWRDVFLPESYTQWSFEQLQMILLHEWGHRMICPISPEQGAIWRKVAEKTGLGEIQAHTVVNIATDLWLDHDYLQRPRWQAVYRKGIQDNLVDANRTRSPNHPADQLLVLLHSLYGRMVGNGDQEPGFAEKNNLAEKAWNILFGGAASPDQRVGELARLLRPLLPKEQPKLFTVSIALPAMGQGRLTPQLLRKARQAGLGSKEIETIFDPAELEAFKRRQQQLSMYARIAPVVERFLSHHPRQSFAGYKLWHVGRPLRELDLLASLQRSSRILPNVSTLTRNYELKGLQGRGHRRSIVLIIDDSGSTNGDVLTREKEVAFAVIAAARRYGDPVGCVVFGEKVTASLPLTSQYAKLEEKIFSLDSESGGTSLYPALTEALKLCGDDEGFTLFLMTDAAVQRDVKLEALVHSLPATSRLIAFCFNDSDSVRQSMGPLIGPRFRVLSASPDEPFTETALEELYG